MSKAINWVAEHVIGFERGRCAGQFGGGTASSDGSSESWFHCDSCGRQVDWSSVGSCPKYCFPDFDLVDLMCKLGEALIPLVVRYDTLRKSDHFTIIGPEGRICDTDDPLVGLCEYLEEQYRTEAEPEDEMLAASGILERLVEETLREPPSENWKAELRSL